MSTGELRCLLRLLRLGRMKRGDGYRVEPSLEERVETEPKAYAYYGAWSKDLCIS